MARRRPYLVPEALAEQRLEMLRCKALRSHAWEAIASLSDPSFGVALDLRCTSCGTTRRDILNQFTGDLLSRFYDYPDGYRDVDRESFSTGQTRLAWARRLQTEGGTRGARRTEAG